MSDNKYKSLTIDGNIVFYDFHEKFPNILFVNLDSFYSNNFKDDEIIELEDRVARLIITYHKKKEINLISYLNIQNPPD